MIALAPKRLFTGLESIEGATVTVRDGRIASVSTTPDPSATKLDGLLAPGFIDVQVNGGAGLLFNDAPEVETLAALAAAHRRFGVTSFMATLISDTDEKVKAALDAVERAVKANVAGVLGLHLEGPGLSSARRGVHPAELLRAFTSEDLDLLARPRPFPLLITVAPERVEPAAIERLTRAGVIVSIGHTGASSEQIDAAIEAGAKGFTHLFNAMPPLEGRKPGAVGAALIHSDAWASLILDGIHVHPVSARVALACKTARRLMLVSDAMATVGSNTSSMSLFGERVEVKDGALRTSAGTLAGAHLELASAVRNARAMLGASVEDALRMATLTPAEFLGVERERGAIADGRRADFVLLDDALHVAAVWVGGEQTL
jgi:N-acetylglucosamine-6-phosphate deacetylase